MSTVTRDVAKFVTTAPVRDQKSNSGYEAIKPWLDIPLALVMLVVSTPIILFCILLVKLTSRGPALYTQKRVGLAGKVFTIYKIRTMYLESEPDGVARWSGPGDPRVTRVGRFLRFCHLDELPQLVNVLMGEMSLVGPRPERPELVSPFELALPNYRRRLSVRPGITGLAQVQQPPDVNLFTVRRKLNYDLCYVERMDLWFDARLILATVLKCLGFPFATIGWILHLPQPNAYVDSEYLVPKTEFRAEALISDSCLG
jgi:lipopolysaccharide/colanic/teichoic acid biosynthesis glycosyltransferase